jgi:phage shock protein C
MVNMNKKLYRSRSNRMLSGVCGGLGDYLNIDVTIIRLVWVLITIMSGGFPGIIAYVIAVFIIPEEPAGYGNMDENRSQDAEYRINNDDETKQ